MINQEIAKILREISLYLQIKNVPFKPQAYEKAALALNSLEEDIEEIYNKEGKKGLEKIPGVGESIADKIEEYLQKGKVKYYEKLKKELPVDILGLTSVEGIGPKMVKALYKKLHITNLSELKEAAEKHQIRTLPHFGERTEKNILKGISFIRRSKGRFLLGTAYNLASDVIEKLKKQPGVNKISIAGSLRRMKETIGDIDILITTKGSKQAKKIMDFFISLPGTMRIWDYGLTKSSIRVPPGIDIDLRIVKDEEFGSALQYFTGSKEHSIALRKLAIKKGLRLNEYGIFKKKKGKWIKLASRTEKEVYAAMGFPYFEPELRTNRGEIEAALQGKLPNVIGYNDIEGDLHLHSSWDGGEDSIKKIAKAASKLGYSYIGITDHTKFLHIEHGLNEKQLLAQNKEIQKLNAKYKIQNTKYKIQILSGCEANILKDGRLDIDDSVLEQLDYVIAGIHSHLRMTKKTMTERIIRAIKNPNVRIIAHPTGRILMKRNSYLIDFDKILRAAHEFKVAMEINATPERLDLNDLNIKRAIELDVKLAINTDSHNINHLSCMKFGIGQARRGWATKYDIINSWPLPRLKKFFSKEI